MLAAPPEELEYAREVGIFYFFQLESVILDQLLSDFYTQGYLPPESFRSTSLLPLGANWVSKEAENLVP